MSLRTRIAATAAVAVALVVVVAAVAIYLGVRAELRGEIDNSLRDRSGEFAQVLDQGPGSPPDGDGDGRGGGGRPLDRLPAPPQERFGGPGGIQQLVLPSGRVLRRPGVEDVLPVDARGREIAARGAGTDLRDETVAGTHLRVYTRGVPRRGAIQVARPLDEVDRQLDRVLLVLLLVGAAGVALGAALAAVVARTALAPIARFTRRTEELAGDPDPSHRMDAAGSDELGRLARSFNSTLDSLERSVESQRQLVADASHELRTPIASLRANIQTLEHAERLPAAELRALRADIVAELDELTALVADIVELARGAKPGEVVDDVRLDEIVAAVADRARSRANGVALELSTEPTIVRGEPERIQRAVSNLVDNALKWSPADGTVEIALAGGELSVRDHGPGFDEHDLPHVFDRFYRAHSARALPGSGLGLAIVRQAAEAQGGTVDASNAAGGGALVRVSFGDAT
ncbi:MAG TPA: HAMP domain-containing sensor histidine kinase [Thermoleophilaceae bacterium]|jgi:two-component system sensor histidine kinase MprB|nr:HAMP domain-containing sensor histidine kinase [Thermoleophilaceae bacterium]